MTFPDRVTHRRSFLHDHTEKYSIASVNLTAVFQFQKSKKVREREKEKGGQKGNGVRSFVRSGGQIGAVKVRTRWL